MSEAVTSADFQSKVLESDVPGRVVKLDIDQSPDIAQRYGVMSVPTLIVFENGQVKRQTVGAQPKQNVLALLA